MRKSNKEQPGIKVLGRLDINGHDILKRVYSADGYCPTLTTMMGGQTQPKLALVNNIVKEIEYMTLLQSPCVF